MYKCTRTLLKTLLCKREKERFQNNFLILVLINSSFAFFKTYALVFLSCLKVSFQPGIVNVACSCHELSQSRYESHIRWATTCIIGSSKYKNLKLKKREKKERRSVVLGV
jgi:hypothetical protein